MTKKIFLLFVTLGVFVFLLWAVKNYLELPTVEFSVSRQKVIAVENFKGEPLPLFPLPKKYKKIYVE